MPIGYYLPLLLARGFASQNESKSEKFTILIHGTIFIPIIRIHEWLVLMGSINVGKYAIFTNPIYIYASPPPPQGPPFKIKSCVFLLLNKKYLLYKIVYILFIIFSTPQASNSIKFIIKKYLQYLHQQSYHLMSSILSILFIILIWKSILLILWIICYIHIIKILNIIRLSIFWITINILSNISDDIKNILVWVFPKNLIRYILKEENGLTKILSFEGCKHVGLRLEVHQTCIYSKKNNILMPKVHKTCIYSKKSKVLIVKSHQTCIYSKKSKVLIGKSHQTCIYSKKTKKSKISDSMWDWLA